MNISPFCSLICPVYWQRWNSSPPETYSKIRKVSPDMTTPFSFFNCPSLPDPSSFTIFLWFTDL